MIRYKHLGYVALNVTDLARSVAFYRDLVGLQECGEPTDECRFFRVSQKHHDLVLCKSDGMPGLKRVGFELESAQALDELKVALDAAGSRYIDIPDSDARQMRTHGGIRVREPISGAVLDFYLSMDPSSDGPFVPTQAKIQRLGHMVLASSDYDKSIAFFTDVLNFKKSDTILGRVMFLRCFPNPFHHSLGIGAGKKGNLLHHVNFMVADVDDIGRAIYRLKNGGVPIVNGPGRHLPSGSLFLYYLDPDGITIEYSFGMEQFPEVNPREPRILPPVPESNDIWGGPVDPRKATVGHIEQLVI